jgi:methyltransferase-like protein/2-polyprenyl-3-methyl-5-hydroxy-6-metoxy-1,4-benzoquinol methylase
MATLAALFGMEPVDINQAQILELGCAAGSNLIPMATQLPGATFVGVEGAARQVAVGQQLVEDLQLGNVTLHHKDILDIDPAFGVFDYIVVHGVYSWVQDAVQEKILSICKQNLSPQGVAYVSYNTYPGWRMRGMLRDMMMYHTAQFAEPQAKVQQARALIEFLAQSVPTENNPYGLWLKQELEIMRHWQDNYILHDSLEEVNEPVYFHEFMERAARQGLQYLGDANFSTMLASNFDTNVQQTLQRVGTTLVAMEQYMDFVRNRMFRHTLLCHEGLELRRNLTPDQLRGFYITSSLEPTSAAPDLKSTERVVFQNANGTITSGQPLVKAALLFLSQQFPLAVVFDEVLNQAHAMLSSEEVEVQDAETLKRDQVMLGEALLLGFSRNLVGLSLYPHRFTVHVSSHPCTTLLIRHQAETGVATNLQHETVHLDIVTRLVVRHLDGQHDHEALLQLLVDRVRAGELVVREKGEPIHDQDRIRSVMTERLNLLLSNCARLALLVA